MVIKKLKERIKSLRGNMDKDKIKQDLKEIETINIELDHRVTKLIAKNEHLKQTYTQLYDSIKPARIQSKEQCAKLISQVNLKSVENSDLNASLQEKALAITTLKDELRKLKGKALVDNNVANHPSDPELHQVNVEPITPKLLNKRTAHSAYIKHSQEEAAVLRDLVDHIKQPILQLVAIRNFKPVVTLVYSRTPRKSKTNVPVSKSKVLKSVSATKGTQYIWGTKVSDVLMKSKTNVPVSKPKNIKSLSANKKEPSKSWGSIVSDVPSSSLDECRSSKLFSGTVKFGNDHVKCLRSKDEAPDFIIKFLKMIQVRLKVPVRRIRTDNGTEFVNQTLREYYEKVGISHETSVARSPQQNGVVERRNRTLIEDARTMLIYAKAPLFLWAEAVDTACYTQNRSIIRLRHRKTPYELLHDKLPDLLFFYVFGAL
ncbi:retrovirus-related pol polyprotein from transposon TNT 1-94 [Tanacetum coccineum]